MPPWSQVARRPFPRPFAPAAPEPDPVSQVAWLANQAGFDPSLLEGLNPDLLMGIDALTLRRAVVGAVAALQEGRKVDRNVGGGGETFISMALRDALASKIAMMPLATRLPLLATLSASEQGDRGIAATPGRTAPAVRPEPQPFDRAALAALVKKAQVVEFPHAASTAPGGGAEAFGARFYDFDSLPGASTASKPQSSGGQEQSSRRDDPERDQREERARERAAKERAQQARRKPEAEAHREMGREVQQGATGEDDEQQRAAEYQRKCKEAAKVFLEGAHRPRGGDAEPAADDRAAAAKRAASGMLGHLERVKAAADAAARAASQGARSSAVDLGPVKKAQNADDASMGWAARPATRRFQEAQPAKRPSSAERHSGQRGGDRKWDGDNWDHEQGGWYSSAGRSDAAGSFEREPSREPGADRRSSRSRDGRPRPRSEQHPHATEDQHSYAFESGRRARGGDPRARAEGRSSRSRDPQRGDRHCRDRDPPRGTPRAEGSRRNADKDYPRSPDRRPRRRSVARSRSRCDRDRDPPRGEGEPGRGGRDGAERRGASAAGFGSTSTEVAVAAPAGAVPEPRLRQVGVRNGWAEFVDERSGTRLYKNVLTGEKTTRQPAEYGSQISEVMNQRRLNWLAATRTNGVPPYCVLKPDAE